MTSNFSLKLFRSLWFVFLKHLFLWISPLAPISNKNTLSIIYNHLFYNVGITQELPWDYIATRFDHWTWSRNPGNVQVTIVLRLCVICDKCSPSRLYYRPRMSQRLWHYFVSFFLHMYLCWIFDADKKILEIPCSILLVNNWKKRVQY